MKKKFNIFIIIFILILVLPAQAKNYYKTDEWVENNRVTTIKQSVADIKRNELRAEAAANQEWQEKEKAAYNKMIELQNKLEIDGTELRDYINKITDELQVDELNEKRNAVRFNYGDIFHLTDEDREKIRIFKEASAEYAKARDERDRLINEYMKELDEYNNEVYEEYEKAYEEWQKIYNENPY